MVAAILPNAKQQFIDINGKPLVGGTVGMFIIGTLIFKNTWQDFAQTILNTNPVVLDSRGQALIYGDGTYRQILKDSLGNLIWDETTSSVFGGSGGSGASQTITHVNSPYTMLGTDGTIFCDVSGGAIIINLLPANEYGAALSVKIKGVATNQVTIIPSGTDTIDGNANSILAFDNQAETFVSDLISYWGTI